MYISTPIMYSHAALVNGRSGVIMIVESGTSGATGTINLKNSRGQTDYVQAGAIGRRC